MKAPPENCRMRLQREGKPYAETSCDACGKWAPRAESCRDELAAESPPRPSIPTEFVAWEGGIDLAPVRPGFPL